MNLNEVCEVSLSRKKRKRIGRGEGSGQGKTSGRGHKGASSRSGWGGHVWYEGGQMPLFRRVPKRGFNNKWRVEFEVVNLDTLDASFEDGSTITQDALLEKGILKKQDMHFKVLGQGELSKKFTIQAHGFSKSAEEKITKAGGTIDKLKTKKEKIREKMKLKKQEFLQKNKKK